MTVTVSNQITGWPLCAREACEGQEWDETGLCWSHFWAWE